MVAAAGDRRLLADALAIVAAMLLPFFCRAIAARMRTFFNFLFCHVFSLLVP
jgi:hypothetical protein